MTAYKLGDVVLVAFPFTDFSTFKQRPAVIISSATFNRSQSDVIILAITSHIIQKGRFDYLLNTKEQKDAGLPKRSIIKLGKIATIDQRLIRKSIGHMLDKSLEKVTVKLRTVIGNK